MHEKQNTILLTVISLFVVTLMLSVDVVFAATLQKSTATKRSSQALPSPAPPNTVLYDQYDTPAGNAWLSDTYDAVQGADDFVIPAGQTWTINEVDVQGLYGGLFSPRAFQVSIYSDANGLPGSTISTRLMQRYSTGNGIDFIITLNPAVILSEGTYWFQCNLLKIGL
jgi:hypothetical protein